VRLDIHRQQLDRRPQAWHCGHQGLLDRGAHGSGAAQRPGRGHVHVQVDETPLAGAASW